MNVELASDRSEAVLGEISEAVIVDRAFLETVLTGILAEGRRYRVAGVRDSGTLECAVHDAGVTAVEVEPAPVLANVPSNVAYAGSKAELAGPCQYTECPSHEFCEPAGADFDEEYQITEVAGEPPHDYCMLDRELTLVEFATDEE